MSPWFTKSIVIEVIALLISYLFFYKLKHIHALYFQTEPWLDFKVNCVVELLFMLLYFLCLCSDITTFSSNEFLCSVGIFQSLVFIWKLLIVSFQGFCNTTKEQGHWTAFCQKHVISVCHSKNSSQVGHPGKQDYSLPRLQQRSDNGHPQVQKGRRLGNKERSLCGNPNQQVTL